MLEHDELDARLNGIDRGQPLSPLDLFLPTDPDIITLISSSSPISPVALPNQQPNQLVDKILQSLTNAPIHFTDHSATSRQESRVNIHCVVAKLNLLKPNRKNHNLALLRQDNSALNPQLWEHRLRTLEHNFRDLIDSNEISKFSNRSKAKAVIGLTNLSEDLDTTPVYTTS